MVAWLGFWYSLVKSVSLSVCVGGWVGCCVKEGVLNYVVSKVICNYQIKRTINPPFLTWRCLTVELVERGTSLMNGLWSVIPEGKQAPSISVYIPHHLQALKVLEEGSYKDTNAQPCSGDSQPQGLSRSHWCRPERDVNLTYSYRKIELKSSSVTKNS